MKPSLLKRGPMRRRLGILRRRREAMLLDLGALVLEMHRHGRFLPDGVARRAAEAVGTDAELRALSRALEAGDGDPDLVAAGVAGNCPQCGALHTLGASYCSQCGKQLESTALPRKAALGQDPALMPQAATLPRRPVPAAAPPQAATAVVEPAAESPDEDEAEKTPEAQERPAPEPKPAPPAAAPPAAAAPAPVAPTPVASRARATRVRQRLNEPSKPSQSLPTGLLAGVAAGAVVIGLGILILTGGGDDGGGNRKPDAANQAPAAGEPEPPPDDAPVTPLPEDNPPESVAPGAALEPVEGLTADAYDPLGDDEEHSEEARLAVDGDLATSWPTEEYDTGALQKDGVGLVLEPAEALPARGLDLATTTPGFDVTIYGAEGELPASIESGWAEIANEEVLKKKGRITLDAAGNDFTHYLIWITAIPEDEGKVEISEASLLR